MRPGAPERRAAPRQAAATPVWIRETLPGSVEVPGTLADTSPNGFRASFRQGAPAAGVRVEFRTEARAGQAVVVWTRCLGRVQESGFFIC